MGRPCWTIWLIIRKVDIFPNEERVPDSDFELQDPIFLRDEILNIMIAGRDTVSAHPIGRNSAAYTLAA